MSDETLKIKDPRPLGDTSCGYIPDSGERCHRPGVQHFLLVDVATFVSCREHETYIRDRQQPGEVWDDHEIGPDCSMPGTMWRFPYADEAEGYCFSPAPDDASALEMIARSAPIVMQSLRPETRRTVTT